MKKESLLTILIFGSIWFLMSVMLNNSILLPGPFDVFKSLILELFNPDFVLVVCSTIGRTLFGCVLSLVFGCLLGICAGNSIQFKSLFSPVHQLLKTIPNITYMILMLIWLGQENSVVVIIFFILFPFFYSQFLLRTETIQSQTFDLLEIYPVTTYEKIFRIYMPMLIPDIFEALKTGVGMGFKVCVMAEILSQVRIGIGREMNYGRLNLDISSVFAWTILLILISTLLQKLLDIVQKITIKKLI
ncbi:MAG: ABC transporter permease subunit [Erysipelotrichaceae bacterium]|nr:ABC transporter permease subunit [Erysipelotrichaceae bacterium]